LAIKFSLTIGQGLRLSRIGGRSNLAFVESTHKRSTTIMNVIHLIARVAQGLLAASITFAFALVFQFGHLA